MKRLREIAALAATAACLLVALPPAANAARNSVPSPANGTVIGKTTTTALANYVRQQAGASHVPGTAIGIVKDNQPVLLKGFGDADADTSFFLGSLSKSFTALAVMQLAGQGKVSLDAPVRRYIPWFAVGDGDESGSITVRDLLDQTSGISTRAGLTELSFAPTATFTQAIQGFEKFPLSARPGKAFQYSDANYTIAGYIVQQASGQSYDSYVRQHIFAPLGMTHTYAMTGTADEPGLIHGYASLFGLRMPLTEQVSAPLVPAGYIISSATDMTRYLTAQLNGGVYDGTRIASASAIREMHAALVPLDGQSPVPDATAYGFGWGTGTAGGTPVIVHDGQLRDFDTAMAILPDEHLAVIVLMNQNPSLVVNDDQLFDGIVRGITTGTYPAVSHSFLIFYVIFDVLVLATTLLMIASFWRTGAWLRKFRARASRTGPWRAAIRSIGLDLITSLFIALFITYGVGSLTGYVPLTPTLLVFAAPDVATWAYALISFLVVRAVVRAIAIVVTIAPTDAKAGT